MNFEQTPGQGFYQGLCVWIQKKKEGGVGEVIFQNEI